MRTQETRRSISGRSGVEEKDMVKKKGGEKTARQTGEIERGGKKLGGGKSERKASI